MRQKIQPVIDSFFFNIGLGILISCLIFYFYWHILIAMLIMLAASLIALVGLGILFLAFVICEIINGWRDKRERKKYFSRLLFKKDPFTAKEQFAFDTYFSHVPMQTEAPRETLPCDDWTNYHY